MKNHKSNATKFSIDYKIPSLDSFTSSDLEYPPNPLQGIAKALEFPGPRKSVEEPSSNQSEDNKENNLKNNPTVSAMDASKSLSTTSLKSSLFMDDFEKLKCKLRIFGESLNICKCIADDYKGKLSTMEKRLQFLETRNKLKNGSNYSAIIQKNKFLASKSHIEVKKLQMCGTEHEMREIAGRICRNYLHGAWKTVSPADLDFRRINGGLSNFLYYVALPDCNVSKFRTFSTLREESLEDDLEVTEKSAVTKLLQKQKSLTMTNAFNLDEPRKVLLRIYGQVHGERAMDAIVTESVIFTLLSERRLGPKLHGVFSGGRIEEYIPARPLLTKELSEPALSMKIAEKMAAIHVMEVPLSKEPNWLWKTMGKWLKTVREERLASNKVTARSLEEENIISGLKSVDFEKEIEWLKKYLNSVESPVVFCHNDMQEGNILMLEDVVHNTTDDDIQADYLQTYPDTLSTPPKSSKENNHTPGDKRKSFMDPYEEAITSDSISSHISDLGEPKLVLIDFEYCAYNYRGFDIANHFQEWVYDYTNPEFPFYSENQDDYPTLEQKEIFIREYLKHYIGNVSDDKEDAAPSIDDVNHLLAEVDAFALASHLFWSLWSIVNASKSQIPFGYWEYALSRYDTFLRLKQEVIKKEKFGLPQKRKICEVDI